MYGHGVVSFCFAYFTFESKTKGDKPMDLAMNDMFGSSPKTIMNDISVERYYGGISYDTNSFSLRFSWIVSMVPFALGPFIYYVSTF